MNTGTRPSLEDTCITFAQYFVAGMIASGILYTSFQNLAISIPLEREDSTLKRLQGTPMPRSSYFIGKIGMVCVAYVAQVIILIAVGVLFFDINIPDAASKWFVFAWVSVLGLISCTLLGVAYSVIPKHGRGASAVVTPVVLILQFTSGWDSVRFSPWCSSSGLSGFTLTAKTTLRSI